MAKSNLRARKPSKKKSSQKNKKSLSLSDTLKELSSKQEELEEELEELEELEDDESDVEADDDDTEVNLEEEVRKAELQVGSDIFTDVGQKFVDEGVSVYYQYYKNGSFMGRKEHPYSWEQMKEDEGPGLYKVVCKNTMNNQILKHESKNLGQSEKDKLGKAAAAQSPGAPSFMELLAVINQTSEKSKIEQQAQAQGQTAIFTAMTAMLTEMIRSSQEQARQQSLEMQKMQMQMSQEQAKSQEKVFTLILAQIQAAQKPQKEPMSITELLTLIETSKQSGQQSYKEMFEMAEERSKKEAKILAEIERLKLEGGGGESRSMTETLIESFGPAIAQALAQQGTKAVPQAVPQRATNQVIPFQKPIQPSQPAQAPRAPQPVQPARTTQVTPAKPVAQNSQAIKEPEVLAKEETKTMNPKTKAIIDTVGGDVVMWLISQKGPKIAQKKAEAAATDTLKKLKKTLRLDGHEVLSLFSLDTLLGVARSYNIPLEADTWLRDYHAAIQKEVMREREAAV